MTKPISSRPRMDVRHAASMERSISRHPDLMVKLSTMLAQTSGNGAELSKELAEVESSFGDVVYQEVLFLLTHLRFEPGEARSHWQEIAALQREMITPAARPVDIRTALVSYFVDINRQLENPKLIELRLFQETEASALRDALTGLFNYRYCKDELAREIRRSERFGSALSVLMVDIDDFKLFNDRYGHVAGNEALVAVSQALTGTVRAVDVVTRFGGEEFLAILPATPKTGASSVAERCRRAVEARGVGLGNKQSQGVEIAVSIGIATYPVDGLTPEELVRCADAAMYVAKRQGKNQVVLHGEDRRTYRRLHVALEGGYRLLSTNSEPVAVLDASEGGFLFRGSVKLDVDTVLDLEVRLSDGHDQRVRSAVRVVRACQETSGSYEYGVRILEMSQVDRRKLNAYLRS